MGRDRDRGTLFGDRGHAGLLHTTMCSWSGDGPPPPRPRTPEYRRSSGMALANGAVSRDPADARTRPPRIFLRPDRDHETTLQPHRRLRPPAPSRRPARRVLLRDRWCRPRQRGPGHRRRDRSGRLQAEGCRRQEAGRRLRQEEVRGGQEGGHEEGPGQEGGPEEGSPEEGSEAEGCAEGGGDQEALRGAASGARRRRRSRPRSRAAPRCRASRTPRRSPRARAPRSRSSVRACRPRR